MMKKLLYVLILGIIISFQPVEAQSIKSIGKSKVAASQAKKSEIRRKAEEKRKADEERQRLAQEEGERRAKAERQAYENAFNTGTRQSLESFLRNYPNSQYSSSIREHLNDLDLWQVAEQSGSISAYQDYLNTSTSLSYKDEANKRIADLRAEQEWDRIKYSNNPYDFQNFTTSYPNSAHKNEAYKRQHELKGIQEYNLGNLRNAYNEFNYAGGKYALSYSSQLKYDECAEFVEYQGLSSYSSETELSSFLSKYPSSKHRKEIMNALAISKARNLSVYSSDYQFNVALSYAQDKETRSIVQNYIKQLKKARKNNSKRQWHNYNSSKFNPGFKFGIDFMDIGTNVLSSSDGRLWDIIYYDFAATIRIGRYDTPVSFETGVKPGWLRCNESDDGEGLFYTDEVYTKFHMPVFAKLKVNLGRAWGEKRFYINCTGYYHAIREKYLEPDFSVGGGFGFAGPHWDWQILYFRQGINKNDQFNSNDIRYWGCSLGYFF